MRHYTGAQMITNERKRHRTEEHFTDARDDAYLFDELALAAICYATPPNKRVHWAGGKMISPFWPWSEKTWRPYNGNRVRELVKAGALIAAEIDKILRAERAKAKSEKARPAKRSRK